MVKDRAEQALKLMMFATTADRLVTGQATAELVVAVPGMVVGMMIAATSAAEATPVVKALTEVADLHSEVETVAIAVEVMAECARRKCAKAAASTAMRWGTRSLNAHSHQATMVHPVALTTEVAMTSKKDAAFRAADLLPSEAVTLDPATLTETDVGNRP